MFERLLIQNFQAHTKTAVAFDPGITCIVGPSDVGKSAVLRALRWVCTNEPGGDAFITHGAKGTTVKLGVDGHMVVRRRSPGGEVNDYRLDEQTFKAFGRSVPEPVAALLALGPVCWQGQHDAPYWFAETAGEVSRQLNSIVNLGIIDDVLARVAQARTKARTRLDMAEENLTAAKQAHGALGWVDGYAAGVRALDGLFAESGKARTRATTLADLTTEAANIRAARDKAARVAQAGDKAYILGAEATEKRQRAATLADLLESASKVAPVAGAVVPDMAGLEAAHKEWDAKCDKYSGLAALLAEARERAEAVCVAQKELDQVTKALPKACPTCGQFL